MNEHDRGYVMPSIIDLKFSRSGGMYRVNKGGRPMRLRVNYTEDVDDELRAAVAAYFHDEDRLATRTEMRAFFRSYGTSMIDDVLYEHRSAREYPDQEPAA